MEKEILRAKFERKSSKRIGVWHTKVERGIKKQHVAARYREQEDLDEINSYLNGDYDLELEYLEGVDLINRHFEGDYALYEDDIMEMIAGEQAACAELYENLKKEKEAAVFDSWDKHIDDEYSVEWAFDNENFVPFYEEVEQHLEQDRRHEQ